MTNDVLSIMQSANLFVYALNNPILFIDPLGLAVTTWDMNHVSSASRTQLAENSRLWGLATTDARREELRIASYNIRRGYCNYTAFLGDGSALTAFSVTREVGTADGSFRAETTITIERLYTQATSTSTGIYDRLVSVTGRATHTETGLRAVGVSGIYGQVGHPGANNISIRFSTDNNSFSFNVNSNFIMHDPLFGESAPTTLGLTANFRFQRGTGPVNTLTVFNNIPINPDQMSPPDGSSADGLVRYFDKRIYRMKPIGR